MDAVMGAYLSQLAQQGNAKQEQFPPDHKPAMRVPKGGSNCAKCRFVGSDLKTCGNPYYQQYYGSNKLKAPADEFCSDWFEPKR